ncbi:MAG: carboxypeptidase-like regulatory domain-containing protein [Bacteroides sp.]|nr:carboxypeptidase-like regulatory domain-containing protein [Bacteroides sp.]
MKLKILHQLFRMAAMFLLFFFIQPLYAQQCITVLDKESGNPVSGAHIYLEDTELIAVTDTSGQFCIPVSAKLKRSTSFSFSHISYEKQQFSWKKIQDSDGVVLLTTSLHALGEVNVAARKLYFTLPYQTLAPLRVPVSSFGATLKDNFIYIVGGDISYTESTIVSGAALRGKPEKAPARYDAYSNRIYRYDIQHDRWEKLPYRFRPRAYHTICDYKDKLYVVGGKRLSTNRRLEYLDHTVEIYDMQLDTILVDPVNPHQAINFASCVYDGNLILLGGSVKQSRSGRKKYTEKVHAFDLKSGFWYEMPSLPQGRETRGIQVGDKFYLIGGYQGVVLKQIESYSLTEGTICPEGTLEYEVRRPALATDGEVIYIFENGVLQTYHVKTGEQYIYQAEIYVQNCEMFCKNGKLYLLGGHIGGGDVQEPSRGVYSIDLAVLDQTRQRYSER